MSRTATNNGLRPQLTWANIIATLALMAVFSGGAWALFRSQFANLEQQMQAQDNTNTVLIKDLRIDLDRLRDSSVLRAEHIEFVKRLDHEIANLQHRLDIIEATRPTTGELQSRASAIQSQIDEIKDRLRFLEHAPRPKEATMPNQ